MDFDRITCVVCGQDFDALQGECVPCREKRAQVTGGTGILTFRQRHTLTQAALAALLGVHVDTVRAWEAGRQAVPGPVRLTLTLLDEPAVLKRAQGLHESTGFFY